MVYRRRAPEHYDNRLSALVTGTNAGQRNGIEQQDGNRRKSANKAVEVTVKEAFFLEKLMGLDPMDGNSLPLNWN